MKCSRLPTTGSLQFKQGEELPISPMPELFYCLSEPPSVTVALFQRRHVLIDYCHCFRVHEKRLIYDVKVGSEV